MGRKKRVLFDELMDGVAAMAAHREGKLTLRTHRLDIPPLPPVIRTTDTGTMGAGAQQAQRPSRGAHSARPSFPRYRRSLRRHRHFEALPSRGLTLPR